MKKIQRKINLESYKIRFAPAEGKKSEWGNVANDFEIKDDVLLELKDNLPLVYSILEDCKKGEQNILRYGTMMNVYSWLKNFIKESKVYKICFRNGGIKLVLLENADAEYCENQTTNEILFSKYIPIISKTWVIKSGSISTEYDENGDKVDSKDTGAQECYKVATDNRTLYSSDNIIGKIILVSEDYTQFLKYFALDSDSGAISKAADRACKFLEFVENNKGNNGDKNGYINIPLYIENDISDLGEFTSVVDFWNRDRKYYIGDKMQDDYGDVFKLVKGSKTEYTQVPSQLLKFVQEQLAKGIFNKFNNENDIEEEKVYIKEENSNFYYVRKYDQGELIPENWEYCGEETAEIADSGITGITESKLFSLKRKKKSYDDEGNELPFIVGDSGDTELIFKKDIPMNIIQIEDKSYYDYIESIEISGDTEGTIIFKYRIGAWTGVTDEGKTIRYAGVLYEESYPFTEEKYDGYIDGESGFTYIKIDYVCQLKDVGMELDDKKLYAKFILTQTDIESDDFQTVAYIKDENLIGLQKINKDIDVNIERGKSSARERHQILGEVSSFDDLINYKNGFFTLKSD